MYTLVTGATSGIGREIAIHLSQTRPVIISGRNPEKTQAVLAECSSKFKHLEFVFDLRNSDSIASELSNFLIQNEIQVADLIYCAGEPNSGPIRLADYSSVLQTMNVNVLSALQIVKVLASAKYNKKKFSNSIFISSIWSIRGGSGQVVYSASKAALDGSMRALAMEFAGKTRFNSIQLGAIISPMAEAVVSDTELHNGLINAYPTGLGKPSDVIGAIDFLLSDSSSWLIGQEIVIDGGRTIDATTRRIKI